MSTIFILLAPILSPLLTMVFAGRWIPVDPWSMFILIIQIVIAPILLGLIINSTFGSSIKTAWACLEEGQKIGLDEAKKRALSIEIGMQKSGLAVS